MRIVEIRCDRCENVVTGNPIKVSMERVKREGHNLGGEYLRELKGLEFCEQCANDIRRFIMQPLYETGIQCSENKNVDSEVPDIQAALSKKYQEELKEKRITGGVGYETSENT